MVSSASTTGTKGISNDVLKYFYEKIKPSRCAKSAINRLWHSDKESFENACQYANGAISVTAFIEALAKKGSLTEKIHDFIESIE